MYCRTICALAILLLLGTYARGESTDLPTPDQDGVQWRSMTDGFAPPATAVKAGPACADPLSDGEAESCGGPCGPTPYRSDSWRIEFALIPTNSHVSEEGFGNWSDAGSIAMRLGLGYEGRDGVGTRVQFWGFDDSQNTMAGDVDLTASTFFWDVYKRLYIENAELVFGGGLAGAGMEYDLKTLGDRARLNSGGLSIFGEGFYPLLRFSKMDVGSIGRARYSLLSGEWRDRGTPFVSDTNHDVMTIVELAFGLEFRHRFGKLEDKYWYIDIVPEFQRWESASLPNVFDPSFQGTSINFGLAW